MIKEKVKNITLYVLVISSLFLTINIWFYRGINFANVYSKVTSFFSKKDSFVKARDTLYLPNNIILNEQSNIIYYGAGEEGFAEIFNDISPLIKELFSSADVKDAKLIDPSEWNEALRYYSFYINYKNSFDTNIMGQIFGVKDTAVSSLVSEIREMVIMPGDSTVGSVVFMLKDNAKGEIYKCTIPTSKDALIEIISKFAKEQSYMDYQYSFVLMLDNADSDDINIIFDPMLAFELFLSKSKVINNYRGDRLVNNQGEKERVLNIFGLNSGTMNEYVESDGSIVCVETFATVRFNADDSIEYIAASGYDGINLINDGVPIASFIDHINYATDFLDRMRSEFDDKGSMRLTSDLLSVSNSSSINMTFDYYMEGKPIILINSDGSFIDNAVSLTITDGYLKRYKHYPKHYELSSEIVENISMIDAVDNLYSSLSSKSDLIYVEDMFLAYADDGNMEQISPTWYAKIHGSDTLLRAY